MSLRNPPDDTPKRQPTQHRVRFKTLTGCPAEATSIPGVINNNLPKAKRIAESYKRTEAWVEVWDKETGWTRI